MEILATDKLSKKYKSVYAVKDVCMHVDEGDIYGFVGENGAGKTTIIRLITGLALPTSGTFSLFGVQNKDRNFDKARGNIAAIVEAATVNRSFTALQNLQFQNIITDSKRTDAELIDLIKLVGLDYEAIKDKKAGNFSLGMRQRLGIATVMVSNPKFVVLDEPMNGLDPQGFVEVRETIIKLHDMGVTFLISSHILAELEKICNKVGFISHGQLLEEISIDELHKKSRKKIIIGFANDDIDRFIALTKINDYEINEASLVIYDDMDVNELMSLLVRENIAVSSINCIEESIEDYYLSLMLKEAKNG